MFGQPILTAFGHSAFSKCTHFPGLDMLLRGMLVPDKCTPVTSILQLCILCCMCTCKFGNNTHGLSQTLADTQKQLTRHTSGSCSRLNTSSGRAERLHATSSPCSIAATTSLTSPEPLGAAASKRTKVSLSCGGSMTLSSALWQAIFKISCIMHSSGGQQAS